jgi:D-alanyl-D-alanine carboxypeptidase
MTRLRMPRTFAALFAAILGTAAATAIAQTAGPSRPAATVPADWTDDYIRAEMLRQRIPAASVAVLKDGRIVKIAGYGVADRKTGAAATPDTVYKIGSISKQFIATGIMLLVREGRLRIDDPVSKYLDGTPATWSGITIRHLLTHTSGIQREAPAFDPWKVQPDIDVVRSAYPLPLRFPPGSRWEYCNTGYFALAEIITRASGTPWADYLRLKVFEPAGMRSTAPTNTTRALANRALGYTNNDDPREAPNWTALRPSGAFLSTVADLAKWDALLDTDTPLPQATRREMWTPVALTDGSTAAYGFGWSLDPLNGHRQVHHGGSLPGFISEYARFVDDRISVIVLINTDDADVRGLARGVAALYLQDAPAATGAR